MFSPTRDQARLMFIDAWRKWRAKEVLSPMEDRVAGIVSLHPAYHALLEDQDKALSGDWTPESGETNPFLHLSLHLAIEEQLAIDQPAGIRAAFGLLEARRPDRHDALHDVLDCLGEAIWHAQRSGNFDPTAYLENVRRKSR